MDKLINLEDLGAFRQNLVNDSATSELATWSSSKLNTELGAKQGALTAGQNISISGDTISAEGYVFDETKGSFANIYRQDSEDGGQLVANTASGLSAVAEGYNTQASGDYGAHAEGASTTASGVSSHAEGDSTEASGDWGAHAEGCQTKASYTTVSGYNHGTGAHAEGWGSEAKHDGAHAEGIFTLASQTGAHAEGLSSTRGSSIIKVTASGAGSHAEGYVTIAQNNGEHAEGFGNVSHTSGAANPNSASDTLSSIGSATSLSQNGVDRRNVREFMYNGDCYILGIGNYDGIHIKNEQGAPANTQTLQEVIAGKQAVLTAGANISISGNTISAEYEIATTAEIEALFVPAPNYPPLNQIWYTTSNGQEYGFEDYTSIWDVRTYQSIMPTSNVYSNGKGVITYPQDLVDMSNFGSIGQWDAENATATAVWLPYLTKTTVINGEGDPQVIYPFSNMLNNVDTLTDVYYPGTVAELTEAMYDTDNEEWKDCLISETSGNRIVSAIHCSDGDFTWQTPA